MKSDWARNTLAAACKSTAGMLRLLGTPDGMPIPLRAGEFERLEEELSDSYQPRVPTPPLPAGTVIEVTHGPFAFFRGICTNSSEEIVEMLVEILGRKMQLRLPRQHAFAVSPG